MGCIQQHGKGQMTGIARTAQCLRHTMHIGIFGPVARNLVLGWRDFTARLHTSDRVLRLCCQQRQRTCHCKQ